MKNKDVVEDFVQGHTSISLTEMLASRTANVFIEGRVIYSYGHHYPLGIRMLDGMVCINKDSYSNTTARHKGLLRRKYSADEIIWLSTVDMGRVIREKAMTKQDVVLLKLTDG